MHAIDTDCFYRSWRTWDEIDETRERRTRIMTERTSKRVLEGWEGRTDFTRQFLPCCRSEGEGDEGSGEVEYRCFHSHWGQFVSRLLFHGAKPCADMRYYEVQRAFQLCWNITIRLDVNYRKVISNGWRVEIYRETKLRDVKMKKIYFKNASSAEEMEQLLQFKNNLDSFYFVQKQ